ncbi:hypothetical protein RB195_020185 [Necator americanus]|uniref:Uncharacterized protein n=1 Tax=Necator americanus TaxID=51031 RepID=A0ABR1CJI6_NECAM
MLVAVFTTMILSQSVGLCLPKRRRAGHITKLSMSNPEMEQKKVSTSSTSSSNHDSNGAKMDVTDLKIEIPPRKETEKQPETDLRSLKDEKNPLLDPNVRDRLMSKRNAEKTKETAQAQHPADSNFSVVSKITGKRGTQSKATVNEAKQAATASPLPVTSNPNNIDADGNTKKAQAQHPADSNFSVISKIMGKRGTQRKTIYESKLVATASLLPVTSDPNNIDAEGHTKKVTTGTPTSVEHNYSEYEADVMRPRKTHFFTKVTKIKRAKDDRSRMENSYIRNESKYIGYHNSTKTTFLQFLKRHSEQHDREQATCLAPCPGLPGKEPGRAVEQTVPVT